VTGAVTVIHLYVMPLSMALLIIEQRLASVLSTGST
jgi:hypothetical protein